MTSGKTTETHSCDTVLCRCQGRVTQGAIELLDPSGVAIVDRLCRVDTAAQLARHGSGPLAVGCSRESPLVSSQSPPDRALRFFPAREYAVGGSAAAPRLAALIAMARLPEPPPVESVPYESNGRLDILGAGPEALAWAARLQGKADGQMQVTVFAEDEHPLPAASPRETPVHRARDVTIDDIYQVRIALEPELAASLAGRLTPEQLDTLRAIMADYAEPARDAEDERRQHVQSLEFHAQLAEFAQNEILSFFIGFMAQILSDLTVYKRLYTELNRDLWRRGRAHQTDLLAALERGDAETARTVMKSHMEMARDMMEEQEAVVMKKLFAE